MYKIKILHLVFIILFIGVLDTRSSVSSMEFPVGAVIQYAGDRIPKGWLACDGSAVSRRKYLELFFVIGTLYGVGDDVRTFNLPDFSGRFAMGLNPKFSIKDGIRKGGRSAVALTTSELPPHTHDKGNLSATSVDGHTHNYTDPGHDHGGRTGTESWSSGYHSMNRDSGYGKDYGHHSHTIKRDFTRITINKGGAHGHHIEGHTGRAGEGNAFSIIPPFQTINYIIYVGTVAD